MKIGLDKSKSNQEEFNSFEELEEAQKNKDTTKNKNESLKTYATLGIVAIGIIILVVVVVFVMKPKSTNTSDTSEQDVTGTTDVSSAQGDDASGINTESDINSLQNTIAEGVSTNEQLAANENAIVDADGNVVSTNGVYDEDGNYISDSEDIIKPGIEEYTQEGGTTTPIVYSADDFIKDLNGVEVNAIYNPKSYSYVFDYVNYKKRRAIMDDGMELYWLDVTYHGKQYRCTTPFYIFKSLDTEGICRVKLELLTVEGGGKIISYMRVAEPDEE